MEILFLGTGASVPSRERAPPCIAVRDGTEIILLDCGEGSQRQLMISPFSFMKIGGIFITHMHGDHFFGLPGLLQTMGLSGRKNPLTVCGPDGFSAATEAILGACEGDIPYELRLVDASPGDSFDFKEVSVEAFATEHGMPSLGYLVKGRGSPGRFDKDKAIALGLEQSDFSRLQAGETVRGISPETVMGPPRKGPVVAYSGDTVKCASLEEAVKGADVLIHEATYGDAEAANAAAHLHSTARQAAEVAKGASCGALILTHISNRYDDREAIRAEAAEVFGNTFLAEDFSLFELCRDGLRLKPAPGSSVVERDRVLPHASGKRF